MRSLEIFSGAGGLALGMSKAGFKHIALIERNKNACNSLRTNFIDTNVIECDIKNFSYKGFQKIDVISGGPPCQPFSLGGKHQGNLDERDMFPYAIKGIKELKPKAFIFENVKGLLRQSFASYFNYIILQLSYPEEVKGQNEKWIDHLSRLEEIQTKGNYYGLKYNVVYRLINAADYGIPQKRERVIIVGIKDSLNVQWSFPKETHSKEKLIWDKYVTGKYWDECKVSKSETSQPDKRECLSIQKLKNKYGFFEPEEDAWITIRKALKGIPDPSNRIDFHEDHKYRAGAKVYPGHTGSFIDEPSKTIKAGDHGVPGGENMVRFIDGSVRYFTVLEAKRIQTFPDNYHIAGSWSEVMRQLGNAVPVKLSHIISSNLFAKIGIQQPM